MARKTHFSASEVSIGGSTGFEILEVRMDEKSFSGKFGDTVESRMGRFSVVSRVLGEFLMVKRGE